MTSPSPLRTLLAPIRRDLEEVETFLWRIVGAGDERRSAGQPAQDGAAWLAETAARLLSAGGKRLRPALVLLGAHAGTFRTETAVPAAAAVELLHLASLVHDDLIDKGELRRGVPTVNTRWGDELAVLLGDYLFGRTLAAASFLPGPPLGLFAGVITKLVTGEVEQLTGRKAEASLADYLSRVGLKTASMFSACCQLGAAVGGAPEEETAAMIEYGWWLGMTYQVVDDLLDVEGDPLVLGKPVGADARCGIATLPALLAAGYETALLEEPTAAASPAPAAEEAWAMARDFAAKAVAELAPLRSQWVKALLRGLAAFVVERRC